MKLLNLRCGDCGSDDLIAIWPGRARAQLDMLETIPDRPIKCWCQLCWEHRFSQRRQPRLPRRGRRKITAEQR